MEQIHPKDLFYQILDGIRSLTHYDHSSALLIREDDRGVAARGRRTDRLDEGAKRARSGLRLPITDDAAALLQSAQVYGFDRHGDSWQEWRGQPAARLASLLDYNTGDGADGANVREASMLCAPLVTRDSLVGVLKIAARHPGQLKPLRRRARRALPIAGRDRHPEPAPHRVAARPRADRRAEARDGRPGAQRLARRQQRARRDAAADPADAGGPARRRAQARACLPRTSSTCRSRCRCAGGFSAGC